MSNARERQRQRQSRQSMVTRPGAPAQIDTRPRQQRPSFKIPGLRWLILIVLALGLVAAVIVGLGALNPPEEGIAPNAIWLSTQWTHAARTEQEIIDLARQLRDHQIGTIYAYTSSLKADGTWSGAVTQRNRFVEVEPLVQAFMQQARQVLPNGQVFAWIEVYADPPQGYRLDNLQIQRIVADFAGRMVNEFGFDGVMLDVKPVFNDNEDLLTLLRAVRASIGLEVPLAVSVPPDFTPPELTLELSAAIAPNTVWDTEYKQRVSLQADQLVVIAHNSYIANPVHYIQWVAYQVQAFVGALDGIDTPTRILISVPLYADDLPAHNAQVESLAAGLDGVVNGESQLTSLQRPFLSGVALYADRDLTQTEWDMLRDKWIRRP